MVIVTSDVCSMYYVGSLLLCKQSSRDGPSVHVKWFMSDLS
jgi:hypothetical protein